MHKKEVGKLMKAIHWVSAFSFRNLIFAYLITSFTYFQNRIIESSVGIIGKVRLNLVDINRAY